VFALIFSRYVWISRKTNISFKTRPNLKRPIDPWWLCNLSLIWWKWLTKLIYNISMIRIEMKHLLVWDLYNFERFYSIWMHLVFPLMFFRNKMRNDLNLIFWFYGFHLCAFISHCCILKNVIMISLGIDSLQSMFIIFETYLFYTYTIVICNFSLLCLRTSKIQGWRELISVIFQLFVGLKC